MPQFGQFCRLKTVNLCYWIPLLKAVPFFIYCILEAYNLKHLDICLLVNKYLLSTAQWRLLMMKNFWGIKKHIHQLISYILKSSRQKMLTVTAPNWVPDNNSSPEVRNSKTHQQATGWIWQGEMHIQESRTFMETCEWNHYLTSLVKGKNNMYKKMVGRYEKENIPGMAKQTGWSENNFPSPSNSIILSVSVFVWQILLQH